MDRLSKRIRAFRKLKGLTQHQLAELSGLSITVIGEVERGNRVVQRQALEHIAEALQVPVQELLGGE